MVFRALLSLCLLCPLEARAAVQKGSSSSPRRGEASGLVAVHQFRRVVSEQLAQLKSAPTDLSLSLLKGLAERPSEGPSQVIESASAELLLMTLASEETAADGYTRVPSPLHGLLGRELDAELGSTVKRLHQDPRTEPALRDALKVLQEERGKDSGLGGLGDRLARFFSGSFPSGTWLGEVPYEPGLFSGGFIVPNERNSHLYAPVLKGKKGALISVGTFRTLNDAALGDFSHVVLFDHDHLTTGFNQANVTLLQASLDRFDYLARLFNRRSDEALFAAARAGPLSEQDFLSELLAREPLAPHDQSPEARELHEVMALGDAAHLATGIEKFATDPRIWTNTIWGSDELFEKVKAKALQGRILAVSGDLAGEKVLASVAASLRSQGIEISALDLSNAHEYVASGTLETIKKAWPRFLSNLSALPFSPDASILFTEHPSAYDEYAAKKGIPGLDLKLLYPTENFMYLAVPAAELLRQAEAGLLPNGYAFKSWAYRLVELADAELRRTGLIVPATAKEDQARPGQDARAAPGVSRLSGGLLGFVVAGLLAAPAFFNAGAAEAMVIGWVDLLPSHWPQTLSSLSQAWAPWAASASFWLAAAVLTAANHGLGAWSERAVPIDMGEPPGFDPPPSRVPRLVRFLASIPLWAAAAVLEEAVIRWALFGGLWSLLSAWGLPSLAAFALPSLLSSFFFGVGHQYGAFTPRFVMGLLYCALFALSGNLLLPIAVHFLHNLSLFAWQLWRLEREDAASSAPRQPQV